MRSQPSRITVACPSCGNPMIVHVRFPIPEHRDIKQPEVIDWVCPGACGVNRAEVRETLGV